MATAQTRPFSRDYSGLINQSVLALCIATIALSSHEYMKRKRRGTRREEPLGSVESWQFGYLYQGRSWAKNPSPPHPRGWPLSWIKPVIVFPEEKLTELRGVDATLYCRFLRGCWWFTLLHTFTTTVILLPIHIEFSGDSYSSKSMNRALISTLVSTTKGLSLLWIHLCLLLWVTITWICTLLWICRGAFQFRAAAIEQASKQVRQESEDENHHYNPHPHPQHPFHSMPPLERDESHRGLRLRTIMVTNVPSRLRSEKELKEYFEYFMSRPVPKPSIGLTSSTQPGLMNKTVSFLFNRLRTYQRSFFRSRKHPQGSENGVPETTDPVIEDKTERGEKPVIERVTIARKMTELASLRDRREDFLRRLETAHIKLARKVLNAVKAAMDQKGRRESTMSHVTTRMSIRPLTRRRNDNGGGYRDHDIEGSAGNDAGIVGSEDRMDLLIRTIGPFVEEFGMKDKHHLPQLTRKTLLAHLSRVFPKTQVHSASNFGYESDTPRTSEAHPALLRSQPAADGAPTIWEALFSLPRTALDPYQPLVHLSALFRGKTVPAIDYYTAKLALLTSLITENRSRQICDFDALSTAFVTFADPDDARRACRYLAVHPSNPLACFVTMAPDFEDLDWVRVMKTTFKAEFVKDWVVDLGVWVFTISWIIPVSLLVALVSIQNIASVIPGLQSFLNRHEFLQEVISSLLPTLLTSGLMILIPLILLLIAKKAHTISTLSALHDRIMTRYHKFLVANILVFFCVGVTALESFFTSFKSSLNVLNVIGESFPDAGPFYVGWVIFTTAMHGGLELGLFGLPLIMYPSTKHQITPRKRAVGIRPRTFNYYYWLPNHLLVVILTLVFSVTNPLLTPFSFVYFCVETVVIKNQLLHVYAKNYEGNGHLILIRLVRFSLDGLVLAQVVFMALMAVVKKEAHVAITAVMIVFTVATKLLFTRVCRAKFEEADILEARVISGTAVQTQFSQSDPGVPIEYLSHGDSRLGGQIGTFNTSARVTNYFTRKFTKNFNYSYSTEPVRSPTSTHKPPNPFSSPTTQLTRLQSLDGLASTASRVEPDHMAKAASSMPQLNCPTPYPTSGPETVHQRHSVSQTRPLVTSHEKHPAWDDSSRMDRPYDNPYYSRPITNHLWLPRNPVGLLDLDDTVNVYKSLTSDPGSGQLGEWLEEHGAWASGLPSMFTSPEASEQASLHTGVLRELDGTEEISLSPAIAERVENLDKEEDVEHADEQRSYFPPRRPSNATGRASTTDSRASTQLGRPSTFNIRSGAGLVSASAASTYASKPSLSSFAPVPLSRRSRSASLSLDPSAQPDLYAQARFAKSRLAGVDGSTASFGLRGQNVTSDSGTVSTHHAVLSEAIKEEERATESRLRQEEEEMKEPAPARSWMTSWMYAKHDKDGDS